MAYQYKKRRKKAKVDVRVVRPEKPKRDDIPDGPMVVHGQLVDSKEEYRLAMSLDKMGVDYHYQVVLFGGKIILDFLVFVPWAVPVEVFGRYYHSGTGKDDLRLAMLFDLYKQEPVVFWDDEMETQAAVDALVRDRLL